MLLPGVTAALAVIIAVYLLVSEYRVPWRAPVWASYSETYDTTFASIAQQLDQPIDIFYANSPNQPVNIPIDTPNDEPIKKTTKFRPHHLLHVPQWALVPDRIASHTGSSDDLSTVFKQFEHQWSETLNAAAEQIDLAKSSSTSAAHWKPLSPSERAWLKNISTEIFNTSQAIYGNQIWPFGDKALLWVQNSDFSQPSLRYHFERTRGHPLYSDDELCDGSISSSELCRTFLDIQLPWLPDRPKLYTNMWPDTFNLSDVEEVRNVVGISSPFTRVIRQNKLPTGTVLNYVSPDGAIQFQVEWFDNHLRATNIAFDRSMRRHFKKLGQALVASSGVQDGRLAKVQKGKFTTFITNYGNYMERGEFVEALRDDLKQDFPCFVSVLPHIPVWQDGIKRAFNGVVGVRDFHMNVDKALPNACQQLNDFLALSKISRSARKGIGYDIVLLWPSAVGGYLRAVSPEKAFLTYPPDEDAETLLKRRTVIFLDVVEKLYSSKMRTIGVSLLSKEERGSISTQALTQYLIYHLFLRHESDNDNDVLMRLSALVSCLSLDDVESEDESVQVNTVHSCVMSGILFQMIDGFVGENSDALMTLFALEKSGALSLVEKKVQVGDLNDETLWKKWLDVVTDGDESGSVLRTWKKESEVANLVAKLTRAIPKVSIVRRAGEDTFRMDTSG